MFSNVASLKLSKTLWINLHRGGSYSVGQQAKNTVNKNLINDNHLPDRTDANKTKTLSFIVAMSFLQ